MPRSRIIPSSQSTDAYVHDSDSLPVDSIAENAAHLWYRDRAIARLKAVPTRKLLSLRDSFLKRDPYRYEDFPPTPAVAAEEDATQEALYVVLATREHVVRGKAGRRLRATQRRGQGKSKDRR